MTTAILILVIVNIIWSFLLYGATYVEIKSLEKQIDDNTSEALESILNTGKCRKQAKN